MVHNASGGHDIQVENKTTALRFSWNDIATRVGIVEHVCRHYSCWVCCYICKLYSVVISTIFLISNVCHVIFQCVKHFILWTHHVNFITAGKLLCHGFDIIYIMSMAQRKLVASRSASIDIRKTTTWRMSRPSLVEMSELSTWKIVYKFSWLVKSLLFQVDDINLWKLNCACDVNS